MEINTTSGYNVRETDMGLEVNQDGRYLGEMVDVSLDSFEVEEVDDNATGFECDGQTIYIDELALEKRIESEL